MLIIPKGPSRRLWKLAHHIMAKISQWTINTNWKQNFKRFKQLIWSSDICVIVQLFCCLEIQSIVKKCLQR